MNSMIENIPCNTGNETIDNLAQSFFIGLFFCTLLGDSYLYVQQFSKTSFMKKQLKKVKNISEAVSCVLFKKYKEEDGKIVIEPTQEQSTNHEQSINQQQSANQQQSTKEKTTKQKENNDNSTSDESIEQNSMEQDLHSDSEEQMVEESPSKEDNLTDKKKSISIQPKENVKMLVQKSDDVNVETEDVNIETELSQTENKVELSKEELIESLEVQSEESNKKHKKHKDQLKSSKSKDSLKLKKEKKQKSPNH